ARHETLQKGCTIQLFRVPSWTVVTYNLRGRAAMRQDRHHGSWHLSRGDGEAVIRGRRSRLYNFAATHLFRGIYRRLARDIAGFAPDGGHVLDVGTGPGVLLAELARIRPDLRLTGVDPSAD